MNINKVTDTLTRFAQEFSDTVAPQWKGLRETITKIAVRVLEMFSSSSTGTARAETDSFTVTSGILEE